MTARAIRLALLLAIIAASAFAAERRDPGIAGRWRAEITAPNAARAEATLEFARKGQTLSGVMRVGADALPLFDIMQIGTQISFAVVLPGTPPGTPYVTVHYMGARVGNALELVGETDGQKTYGLSAHRGATAQPPRRTTGSIEFPAPPKTAESSQALSFRPTTIALQADPEESEPAPAAQLAVPAPAETGPTPSWRPIPDATAANEAPAAKLPLPPLHDVAPVGSLKAPPMGWASRQRLGTKVSAEDISEAAEGLDISGLKAVGYVYIELDDGWQGVRDASGVLHPNAKFPDMKALIADVHGRGLKFGLTTAAAPKSCSGLEGSYGHEAEDARAFAGWGVDYIIYEWCGADKIYTTSADMQAALQKMGEAIKATGRDIAYAIDTGGSNAAAFAAKTGAIWWRSGKDVSDNWASLAEDVAHSGALPVPPKAHWNEPGLIQAGNGGMTDDEYRMQLNVAAVIGGPMMLGNDVRIMRKETVALLTNKELIAVDQDPDGQEGKRVAKAGDTEVWAKPLAGGSIALALINRGASSAPAAVTWDQLGIEGPRQARDLWWHQPIGTVNERYVAFLSPHTSMLVKLTKPGQK